MKKKELNELFLSTLAGLAEANIRSKRHNLSTWPGAQIPAKSWENAFLQHCALVRITKVFPP